MIGRGSFFVAIIFCLYRGNAQYDTCTNGTITNVGNGRCDAANNNPSCGFDGCDCCSCTCTDSLFYSCTDNEFDCLYPDCGDDSAATIEETTCVDDWKGDGFCDWDVNNTPACGYDGGDCCECSCADGQDYACGIIGFACKDPACFDPIRVAELPDCPGDWLLINDSVCNAENNNAACGYDGGDCCLCSCSGPACTSDVFDCVDPGAGDEFHQCKLSPPSALPCSAEVQQTWVVEDSAKARALAAAVNCSGGWFQVEWIGSVVVDEPFYVVGGTVLTVTGVDSNAIIDGNGSVRLFTVVNASLYLSDVMVTSGASTVGGAIAAERSRLTFNRTSFVENSAVGNGGAVYVSRGSSVFCVGGGNFVNNSAAIGGGAIYVTGSSVVSCGAAWLNNSAGDTGGAIWAQDDSLVSWNDESVFSYNTAGRMGGAVALSNSTASWNATTGFYSNIAVYLGGALVMRDTSFASWSGVTIFTSNTASEGDGRGGALYIFNRSGASWSSSTTLLDNEAGYGGGALYVGEFSNVSWSGGIECIFDGNKAGFYGGAVFMTTSSRVSSGEETTNVFSGNSVSSAGGAYFMQSGSSVVFGGSTAFGDNRALGDPGIENSTGVGGGLCMLASSFTWNGDMTIEGNMAHSGGGIYADWANIWWSGETTLANNTALDSGGAMFLTTETNASWAGETLLFNNSAEELGGAVHAQSSTLAIGGSTTFVSNRVGDNGFGGALEITFNSSVDCSGSLTFVGNSAGLGGGAVSSVASEASWTDHTTFTQNDAPLGGAVYLISGSHFSFGGSTSFGGNTALTGGALFLHSGSIRWTGEIEFTSNEANADGGAVGSPSFDPLTRSVDATLFINGTTTFFNNTCGANGGALALLGGLSIETGMADIRFVENTAAVAGGAVFVSGTSIAPVFVDASFVSNSAKVGGAISAVGSGTAKEGTLAVPQHPTTFDRCRFIDNRGTATGGAIESAAGQDAFIGSIFRGNKAGTGGALRLAGTAYIGNCSFVENISDDGGGAAVSNIGYLSGMTNNTFSGNVFDCESGMFLDYNASGRPFDAACSGCQTTCEGCVYGEPPSVPVCSEVMDHSASAGGTITMDMVTIDRGYWRATNSSTDVLACYHADACLGGATGASDYCLQGYGGPYCSVCNDGYTAQLGFTCSKCSFGAGGIVLAVVLALGGLFIGAAVVSFMVSGEAEDNQQGYVYRLTRYIPLQSVKIVIVAWQILTQFTSVANVTYPNVYQPFLDGLDVFNFDLTWVLSAGCVFDVGFHGRLLISTISPIIALLFLCGAYVAATHVNRGKAAILQIVWNKYVSMVLLLTFLVYSGVSSILFTTFACEELADGNNYLRVDYRIQCDSPKHRAFQMYAGLMIALYTIGIPAVYVGLLFRDREVLKNDEAHRRCSSRVISTSDLWKPYKPSVFYYEVIECGRRILLAGVVVFIYPNTAAQIAITLLLAFAFMVVSEGLAPYASRWDAWISRMGHAVVVVSMYVALLLIVDVSDERASSQRVFEAVLIAAHASMVLAVVGETIVLAWSFRVQQGVLPWPRFRSGRIYGIKREVAPAKGDPFSLHVYEGHLSPVG